MKDFSGVNKKIKKSANDKWANQYLHIFEDYELYDQKKEIQPNVKSTLEDTGLIQKHHNTKNFAKGFSFLQENVNTQVNTFIYHYVKHMFKVRYRYNKANREGFNTESSILNFIFHLNLLVPGLSYCLKSSDDLLNKHRLRLGG